MNRTPRLVCQSGPLRGQHLDLPTHRVTIGRDPTCDIRLDDPKISRIHGFLEPQDGRFHFIDNRSTNGSFMNGERIREVTLTLGDSLQLGGTELVLLEQSDFQTINFVASQTMVTSVVAAGSVRADALADKFNEIFEYYKNNAPSADEYAALDIGRMQRNINGLKTLFAVSQSMTQLVSVGELVGLVTKNLFEVFGGAENVVVLLLDGATGSMKPAHAATRGSDETPQMSVSRTVLDQAIKDQVTVVANDAVSDSRFSSSESIVGMSVKSVMCAPLVAAGRVLGALYIDNRAQAIRFDDMDAELVTAFANQAAVAIDNARLCDELQTSYHQTLQALVNAIEAKDPYTMGHTARVARISLGIAREMNLTTARIDRLKMAAELHDIGKIGVKEGIINKSGALTDEEYEDIKLHVEMGEMILKPIKYLEDILPYIRGHHEKWDGTGYPDGLKEEECPLEGRIIALADAFDAMTSQRSYNKALSYTEAIARVEQSSGKHFDPDVVRAFVRMMAKISATREGRASGFFEDSDLDMSAVPGISGVAPETSVVVGKR